MTAAFGVLLAWTVVVGVSLLSSRLLGRLRWVDAPYLFVLVLAFVYLELSPSLAVLGRSLPGIRDRATEYFIFQIYALLFFFVPLVVTY